MELQIILSGFFAVIEDDVKITATQISLYHSLLWQWNSNNQVNPFQISRNRTMLTAKISSRSTFNKCMRQLHASGYIKYIPSYHPEISSMVCINTNPAIHKKIGQEMKKSVFDVKKETLSKNKKIKETYE